MGKSSATKQSVAIQAGPVSRGARRRLEIVAVAERMFLAHGYGETTMQMVAVEAGASKETLYRHFGSKEEMFGEIVSNRAQRLRRRLDAEIETPDSLGDVLCDLGRNLLESMTSPEVVALMRIVVSESQRDPALGRLFYAVGPERTRTRLTEFLLAARARGEFHGANPGLAASIFLGAIVAQAHTERLVLRDPARMTPGDIAERVSEVVAMFLCRYTAAPN